MSFFNFKLNQWFSEVSGLCVVLFCFLFLLLLLMHLASLSLSFAALRLKVDLKAEVTNKFQ